jgi:superfamily I DNA and/or RNA helicase
MTEASNDDDDDSTQVSDIESILGLFVARGLPQRMLRWHYRSRHQSLIAVSNSQFYENKLFIVPSPYIQEAGMGLRFHHVAEVFLSQGQAMQTQLKQSEWQPLFLNIYKPTPIYPSGLLLSPYHNEKLFKMNWNFFAA